MVNWKRLGIDATTVTTGAAVGAFLGPLGAAAGAGIGALAGAVTGEVGYAALGQRAHNWYTTLSAATQAKIAQLKTAAKVIIPITTIITTAYASWMAKDDLQAKLAKSTEKTPTKIIDTNTKVPVEGKVFKQLQDGKYANHPFDFKAEKALDGSGYVLVHPDRSVDVATWQGASEGKANIHTITTEKSQKFLEDLFNAPVEVVSGDLEFHGLDAKNVASAYLGINASDVAKVVVLQDLSTKTGMKAFARAYDVDGKAITKDGSATIALKATDVMSINEMYGNQNINDNSFAKALESRGQIGMPNLEAYMTFVNFGEKVGKSNLFGQALTDVVTEVGSAVQTLDKVFDGKFADGQNAMVKLYAAQVNASTGIPIENLTAALAKIPTAEAQITYLTNQMKTWADGRIVADTDGSTATGITQTMSELKGSIWSTYSNIVKNNITVNYLQKVANITTESGLDAYKTPADLMKLVANVELQQKLDDNRAGLESVVYSKVSDQHYHPEDLTKMSDDQLVSLLDIDGLADFAHALTGKQTKDLNATQLRDMIVNWEYNLGQTDGIKTGETHLLEKATAYEIVLNYGSDPKTLDAKLDVLGPAGSELWFNHDADGANRYAALKTNMSKDNKTATYFAGTNITVDYELSGNTIRVDKTEATTDSAALWTEYDSAGNMLPSKTKILNAEQYNYLKTKSGE